MKERLNAINNKKLLKICTVTEICIFWYAFNFFKKIFLIIQT